MVTIIAPMASTSIIPFSDVIKLWCSNQFNNIWTKNDREILSTGIFNSKLYSVDFLPFSRCIRKLNILFIFTYKHN